MIDRVGVLRRGAFLGVVAAVALVALGLPAAGSAANSPGQDNNQQPQNGQAIRLKSCQTISAPGEYRLDANLITTGADCFDVFASGVTVYLDGHTITGQPGDEVGIDVDSGDVSIVGPGKVTGWLDGVDVEDLGSSNVTVRGVTATQNFDAGINVDGDTTGNSVLSNVVTGNGTGIQVDAPSSDNTISGNVAHRNGTDLVDDNPGCGTNVWRDNNFGTASPSSCIH